MVLVYHKKRQRRTGAVSFSELMLIIVKTAVGIQQHDWFPWF